MIEKALAGGWRYRAWVATLLAVLAGGGALWRWQLAAGAAVTGLGRDVTWGIYVGQFTFLAGVAASTVVVVLPYYLHDDKAFGPAVILGQFLGIAALVSSGLFILVDLGQPARVLNALLHPAPASPMFWDMVSLGGYLLLNVVIAWTTLEAERSEMPPPRWLRALILLSIPWAIGIHTVTAFLYCGLPGRPFWFTALLVPRFLASAFASGPALLILLCLAARRLGVLDVGLAAVRRLGLVVAYAMAAHVFLLLTELFTVFHSRVPDLVEPFRYLYLGVEGHAAMVPWMWASAILGLAALIALLVPALRRRLPVLAAACGAIVVSLCIDKGFGFIVGGMVPSPLGGVVDYRPTPLEIGISAGVWALGALLVTAAFQVVSAVRNSTTGVEP